MPRSDQRIAVVTGGNRGIGLEVCRQLAQKGILVILTSRDEKKGLEACKKLEREELPVKFHKLDVDHATSISTFKDFIGKKYGRCDILINNAGIFPDTAKAGDFQPQNPPSILKTNIGTIKRGQTTNVYGPILMCQAFIPLMQKNKYGRIVNMSSGMGQLSDMNGFYPSYRISKTALNAVTRILSEELQDKNILVNSMCPGWVRTDMGGPNATRDVEEGADTAVYLATLSDSGPSGKFFRDRREIPW